ncbi:CheR family methyltransferase [Edaphobacter flagellatus]|uniref:CheR family methyltransferase n=1 Tax=Edaphobacter flagellatus TaxID=1933044 RepID=UPI0021B2C73F|nr:protein-glutamate O-methyltransferase CheR [Edaphobacter flagellatus]
MGCSDADYSYLRDLVLQQSANLIDPSRNALFDTRLTPVVQMAGASSVKDLVKMLRTNRPAHLHRAVAEAMTINETSFFRDVKPYELLRRTILPRLMEEKKKERRLRIWSAASSTGQEAYSMAMLMLSHFPELADWDVKIVGTDISRRVVEYAKRGRYSRLEVNRGLPAGMLLRYMVRDGEEWEISAQVRAMCEFHCANLCMPLSFLPVFDLVLLRNVLLYFSQQDRSTVFRHVHRQMAREGYLLLGNAEQADESTDQFAVEFSTNESSYFYRPA